MKKIFKVLLLSIILVVSSMALFACDEGTGKEKEPGLLLKKFKGDDFYTVVSYVEEDGVSVLDLSTSNTDGVAIGRIKTGAFDGNESLIEVIVPTTVTEIDAGAFKGMKSLEKITLPFVGVNANGDAYPNQTPSNVNKAVDAERTFAYIFGTEEYEGGAKITNGYGSGSSEYYIPSSLYQVTVTPKDNYDIPMYAFYGLTQITRVSLSEKVVGIGEYAFAEFTTLKVVNIPSTVKNIYKNAFECCEKLDDNGLKFAEGIALTLIGDNAFTNTAIKTLNLSVEEIGDSAFAGLGLTKITLKDVKKIGNYAFYNCTSLAERKITLASGVEKSTAYGVSAFEKCPELD